MERAPNHLAISGLTVFLLLFAITLSRYHLYIGFSLKIYMIFVAVLLCVYFRGFYFRKLYHYEVLLLFFYFAYCVSGAFSEYPEASVRIMLGVIIVLGSYVVMRFILGQTSIHTLETAIGNAGILFNGISLLGYIAGLVVTGISVIDVEIISFGLLVDRDYPRLIGLLDDPNIFIFYNTLFYCFFLTHLKGYKHSIGFLLCVLTSLLTFSRGGLLALLIVSIFYFVSSGYVKKIKGWFVSLGSLAVMYVISLFTPIDMYQILMSRMHDFSSDQGSGRMQLWEQAWHYFTTHPLLGIGAFNFSDRYAFHYNETLYVHNTYLEILAESGLIGFLFYASFLILFAGKIYQTKLYKTKPFIVLIFFGFLLQMISLSLIINEMFFLFLAIVFKYIDAEGKRQLHHSKTGEESTGDR